MTTLNISNINDAASEALRMYHESKDLPKVKGENLLDKAINTVFLNWGTTQKYESKEFKEILFRIINKWKKEKKDRPTPVVKIHTPPSLGKMKQIRIHF